MYIYIYIENQKLNPSCRWRLAESHHVMSSLAERSNPNTKANQTQSTKVFIKKFKKKKKKIPNTQTKIKPSNPRTVTSPLSSPQRACRRHRCSPGRPSSQIEDRRTQIALPLLRCSVLPPALPQGISLFFSLTLSQSLCLYLTEINKEMNRRSTS